MPCMMKVFISVGLKYCLLSSAKESWLANSHKKGDEHSKLCEYIVVNKCRNEDINTSSVILYHIQTYV